MQIKKIVFLIIFCLFLCVGCTTKYTLTINKDGTVEENLFVSEEKAFFDNYPHSSKGLVISNMLAPYLDDLNNNNYSVSPFTNNDSGGVIIKKTYKSIEDYVKNSIIYKQYTKEIKIDTDGDYVTITADGKFSHSEQNQEFIPIYDADVIINLPYKVKKNNAEDHNDSSYVWTFSKKDEKNRTITITYNKKKLANNSDSQIIIILVVLVLLLVGGFIFAKKTMSTRKGVNKI